jgi:hypothetical protein
MQGFEITTDFELNTFLLYEHHARNIKDVMSFGEEGDSIKVTGMEIRDPIEYQKYKESLTLSYTANITQPSDDYLIELIDCSNNRVVYSKIIKKSELKEGLAGALASYKKDIYYL